MRQQEGKKERGLNGVTHVRLDLVRPAESTAANLAPKMVGQSFVCGKWMGVGVGKPASCCLPGSGHFWESGAQKTSKMVLKTFPKRPK